jgi:hypothetical protein
MLSKLHTVFPSPIYFVIKVSKVQQPPYDIILHVVFPNPQSFFFYVYLFPCEETQKLPYFDELEELLLLGFRYIIVREIGCCYLYYYPLHLHLNYYLYPFARGYSRMYQFNLSFQNLYAHWQNLSYSLSYLQFGYESPYQIEDSVSEHLSSFSNFQYPFGSNPPWMPYFFKVCSIISFAFLLWEFSTLFHLYLLFFWFFPPRSI